MSKIYLGSPILKASFRVFNYNLLTAFEHHFRNASNHVRGLSSSYHFDNSSSHYPSQRGHSSNNKNSETGYNPYSSQRFPSNSPSQNNQYGRRQNSPSTQMPIFSHNPDPDPSRSQIAYSVNQHNPRSTPHFQSDYNSNQHPNYQHTSAQPHPNYAPNFQADNNNSYQSNTSAPNQKYQFEPIRMAGNYGPNSSSVSIWPFCVFNDNSMVMIKPRPATFDISMDYNRYYLASSGSLEMSFTTRLPNARHFDKSTRQTVFVNPEALGNLLIPLSCLFPAQPPNASPSQSSPSKTISTLSTAQQSSDSNNSTNSSVEANTIWTSNLTTSQKGTNVTFSVTGKTISEAMFNFVYQGTPNKPSVTNNETSSASSSSPQNISSPISVSLKLSEFLALQQLLQACLPTLFGWQFVGNPSLVTQFLKK